MAQTFHCTLVTPEEQILDEAVTYANIPAHDGQIGLAPQRAPLLVKLGDGVLRLDFTEGGSRWFYIGGGFAQMKNNKLTLLSSEAIPAEDIVKGDVETALQEARSSESKTVDAVDDKTRKVNRAKTMINMVDELANKI